MCIYVILCLWFSLYVLHISMLFWLEWTLLSFKSHDIWRLWNARPCTAPRFASVPGVIPLVVEKHRPKRGRCSMSESLRNCAEKAGSWMCPWMTSKNSENMIFSWNTSNYGLNSGFWHLKAEILQKMFSCLVEGKQVQENQEFTRQIWDFNIFQPLGTVVAPYRFGLRWLKSSLGPSQGRVGARGKLQWPHVVTSPEWWLVRVIVHMVVSWNRGNITFVPVNPRIHGGMSYFTTIIIPATPIPYVQQRVIWGFP